MSFDLVVLSAAKPLDADEARDVYERLAKGAKWSAVLTKDDRVAQFVALLSSRWPDLDSLPKSQVDSSPWSGAFEVSPGHAILTMRLTAPDAVVEFCLAKAMELGLNVFDPQDGTLYSSGQEAQKATPKPQKRMTCERCGKAIEPGTPYAEAPQVLHMACLMARFS